MIGKSALAVTAVVAILVAGLVAARAVDSRHRRLDARIEAAAAELARLEYVLKRSEEIVRLHARLNDLIGRFAGRAPGPAPAGAAPTFEELRSRPEPGWGPLDWSRREREKTAWLDRAQVALDHGLSQSLRLPDVEREVENLELQIAEAEAVLSRR